MRKDSLFISILKLALFSAIAGLLGMLYWSSLLVEQDLNALKIAVSNISNKLNKVPQWPHNIPNAGLQPIAAAHSKIDEALPNLVEEDPFFLKTLPNMLGPDFIPQGLRKTASYGKPETLHPYSNWADVGTWQGLCLVSISKNKFGYMNSFSTYAANKVEERKVQGDQSVEYWVHLRNDLAWQPLEQSWFSSAITLAPHFLQKSGVTSHDFKFWFDLIMNPFISESRAVVLRQFYSDVEEVRVEDDYTLAVRWKTYPIKAEDGSISMRPKYLAKSYTMAFTPLARFVYQYYPDGTKIVENDQDPNTYRTNSTFAQLFLQHWAKNVIPSCGPMKFDGFTDQSIRFKRNPDFYNPIACLVDGLRVDFKQSDDTIWQAFKQGTLDNYNVQPEQLLESENFLKSEAYQEQSKKGMAINQLNYAARIFFYIGWNGARPLFSSSKVRRALTMAIDRQRIISQILHGQGMELAAPFFPYSDAYDPSLKPWPFDPLQAKKLLEEEGFYDMKREGILYKKTAEGNLKFSFRLNYFIKNPTTKAICEYVATALKEIGVQCELQGMDLADMTAIFDDKNFDAYFLGWGLSEPPEDPRQLWHSSGAKEKGSSNAVGFANAEVDRIIEALTYEYDVKKRIELYHQFVAIFHEQQPYTLLYLPLTRMLYREYLQNVFLPVDRQDILPGANVAEPDPSIYWIKKK